MINNTIAMMWMKKYSLATFALAISLASVYAQPAEPQKERILILDVHAHTGTGVSIENAAVGFSNGKIDFVGTASQVNRANYNRVIEAAGQHLFPGFIAVNSTLGLLEIDAIRATNDMAEVGAFNPNVRSIIAYNAESTIIPTATFNGILLAQITPRGGVVSGTSSVVQLDAWNWEDATIKEDDGIHLNWPALTEKSGWYLAPGELKASEGGQKTIVELEQFFKDAKNYCAQTTPATANLRLKAMCGLFNGSKTLYIHAHRSREIASSIQFAKKQGVQKIVIVGGYEALMVADMLRENKIPVMLKRIYELPELEDEAVEQPYQLPALLHARGIKFCFDNDGAHERMMVRNIPFYAGTAVAYGLPYEQAVRALTLDAAEIVGIDKTYGSLEIGKSATFFLSQGDALDITGNQLLMAYIDGREINLKNRQQELFERFREKYSK
jgi:imidazolonepropionase-like amidohydrolase